MVVLSMEEGSTKPKNTKEKKAQRASRSRILHTKEEPLKDPALPNTDVILRFSLQYIEYLSTEVYKYITQEEIDSGAIEDFSIFTSSFFDVHADKSVVKITMVEITDSNMDEALNKIASAILNVSIQLKLQPMTVLEEFMSAQKFHHEAERHKVTGIYTFLKRRVSVLFEQYEAKRKSAGTPAFLIQKKE